MSFSAQSLLRQRYAYLIYMDVTVSYTLLSTVSVGEGYQISISLVVVSFYGVTFCYSIG